MIREKNAVMLADTRPALVGTVLLQLKKTNPGLFTEAIIYYIDPISENDKKVMQDIMPCRFVKYNHPLPDYLFEKPRFKRFSALMFCRYEMFSYLDEFDTITWLDTDILIQGDLSGMIIAAEKTGAVFIREDPINKTAEKPDRMRSCFNTDISGFATDEYLYCSGTIVLSKKIGISSECTDWCYKQTIKWADILDLPDQGVLNAAIQKFRIKVRAIPGKKYCCYPSKGRDCSDASIIHAWGSNKFWNDWYVYIHFPEWKSYYEEWMKMGGISLGYDINPSISVVIPSYKPNLGLMRESIDSLMNQNRNNWERFSDFEIIIVAEPFVQENLKDLIESYNDERIRLVFNEERLGIAASLNKGMRLAKGKYIARVDDDDICASSRLFLQKEYLEKHPEIDLCTTDFEYFGDMNEWRLSFEGEMCHAWSIFTCPFDHPTIMFRKKFFFDNDLFYDEKRGYVEDWELWRRAFDKGMKVGCIHDVLFYHRWMNTGSAGQTNKTIDMMRELIQKNFHELEVEIPTEDLSIFGPWNGRLINESDISKLEQYLQSALKANEVKGIYDQKSLEKAFELRLTEARTGTLPGLSKKINRNSSQSSNEVYNNVMLPDGANEGVMKPGLIKRILKKILRPFYRPFFHRYEERIIRIQDTGWVNEGHIMDCISKLDRILEVQQQQEQRINVIEDLQQQHMMLLEELELNIARFGWKRQDGDDMLYEKVNKILETQQMEIQKLEVVNDTQNQNNIKLDDANNMLKQYESKIDDFESDISKELKAQKDYFEASNNELNERIYNLKNVLGFEVIFPKTEEIHRHIDFTYRDLMIALENKISFLPEADVILETEYPVAYDSLDHLHPHGTIRDNTRYPRFIKKCEQVLGRSRDLSFLDLGCSGGGMVLEAALRGHRSMGLEGSDCSLKEQRAEWRLLGNRLMTCDITKPFLLKNIDGAIQKFDIITAWEVMEHIHEEDLQQLFENIKMHLAVNGMFIASIANWDDIDPVSGVNWHVPTHSYEWWKEKFESAGFLVCTELIDTIDLARGGYNPPHCYEKPYPDIDLSKSFHIVVRID